MKPKPKPNRTPIPPPSLPCNTWIQAPLFPCLHVPPKLYTIEGRGSGRQGPSPPTPPEEPTND